MRSKPPIHPNAKHFPHEDSDVNINNSSGPLSHSSRTFTVFRRDPRARLPMRANNLAIGWDVYAFCISETGRSVSRACHRGGVTAIPTGLVVRPPEGYYFQCCSRSGLAQRGIFVANSPGIIDPDYTGELIILLANMSHETHYVAHEHRIAQLILCPIINASLEETEVAPRADGGRGELGFGSSGV